MILKLLVQLALIVQQSNGQLLGHTFPINFDMIMKLNNN